MMKKSNLSGDKGYFTIPGEAGYEALTLELAEKWGADAIRDSDGTKLSDEIINSGYGIYSTICIIRDHNEWARKNRDKLQQTFLSTQPKISTDGTLRFHLLEDFYDQQFEVNASESALPYWQVFDRTTNSEVPREKWYYEPETGDVVIHSCLPWHKYTVSFLAYRIWEEISMYNHTTNNWNKEHLMQIDPIHPETREYLLQWMEHWCQTHPDTTVVRFTSLFYNFVWIWGSSDKNRHLFTDWGSYDFTVSPAALNLFAEKYGYRMSAEDFVNQGKFHVTHMPPNARKLDWMEFIHNTVVAFGKQLIEIVHKYGKLAYVFYDDSWIGLEPYSEKFAEFGFDGIIKCVFSGFEARMCAGVKGVIHELRLHPYLFPVGLNGVPTFSEGGNPSLDAKKYWIQIRRALLQEPVDRIGLGGYLHLVREYPDFCDYIEKLSDEFRTIKKFHQQGSPWCLRPRVAVLHAWGRLRSWTLSGHYHETYMHDLININESLSGLPVDVCFIGFDDITDEKLSKIDVIINAGFAGSAWSGAEYWKDDCVVETLTKWVYHGGVFFGVNQPSAVDGYDTCFRMAHILGVDWDNGARICHGKWKFEVQDAPFKINHNLITPLKGIYLTDGKAKVYLADEGLPVLTINNFGKGKGIYLSSFVTNPENTRLLLDLLLFGTGELAGQKYITDNYNTECVYYPGSQKLVIINNSDSVQSTTVLTDKGRISVTLDAYEMMCKDL